MIKKIVTGIVPVLFILILAACGKPSVASVGPISPTWIKPAIESNTVVFPLEVVKNKVMTHFEIGTSAGKITTMAYILNGVIYVRSDICPPCRSESFSLVNDTLVCDACGTVFNAKNGEGVKGACVSFPKAAISYDVQGDNIKIKIEDLLSGYQNTLKPGLP